MASDRRPSVVYSQNFLKSARLAEQLVRASDLDAHDTIVEIGPGKGVLTTRLAARCHQVIAVEKDPALTRQLTRRLAESGNVVLYEADFLDLPLPITPYKVFANIPFNITSEIVTKLTRAVNPPEVAYLVMQREAAGRFTGQPRETLLSILLKPWFEPAVTYRFRRVDFVPPPRVDVVLLRFSKRGPPLISTPEAQTYRDFVVYGFTAWQPTIRAAYQKIFSRREFDRVASRLGLDPRAKPGDVSFEQWLGLHAYFTCHGTAQHRKLIAGAERRLREQQARLQKTHRTRTGASQQQGNPAR